MLQHFIFISKEAHTMSMNNLSPGKNPPEHFNVVIEIPANSTPVKYEVDKDTGLLTVDRFLGTAMHYPVNYGYVPKTLAGDGDPVDVLVITPFPLVHGCVIAARTVGVLKMQDDAGEDYKLIAVPVSKLHPASDKIQSLEDVCPQLRAQIQHFFEHYKDLEKGKWVKILGWGDAADAKKEIVDGIANYKE